MKNIKEREEHIVLIQEPSSKYLGHVTPKTGNAVATVAAIQNYLKLDDSSSVLAIGVDGTNVNTGMFSISF